MKITSSAISMASQRSYAKTEQSYEESVDLRSEVAATLGFSEEAKENYMVQLNDQLRGKKRQRKLCFRHYFVFSLKHTLLCVCFYFFYHIFSPQSRKRMPYKRIDFQ